MVKNIEIKKIGGSQQNTYVDCLTSINEISARAYDRKIIVVLSAPGKTTKDIYDLIWDRVGVDKARVACNRVGKYFKEKISKESLTHLKNQRSRDLLSIRWDEAFDFWNLKIKDMSSRNQVCWRKGILALGEIYQIILVQLMFSEEGLEVETALNDEYFFRQIIADPDKNTIYNRTYRNIRSWDFLKNDSIVALVPGFAAVIHGHDKQWGITNLGLEGSDETGLIFLKALHGRYNRVSLIFHKSIGREQLDGLESIDSTTEFRGKPLLGKQSTSFIKKYAKEGWRVYLGIPGYLHPFQYFKMKVNKT